MKPLSLFTLVFLLMLMACQSNDQKEKKEKSSESTTQQTTKADISDVEKGIRSYIRKKTKQGEGYFHIENDSLDRNLRLVRVHTEYLSVLEPGRYFACVDLADTSGDVYDVDFFLEGEPGDMQVTQTSVHKLNGKPFYTWKQKKDKTWHRVPVKEASNELLGVVEGTDSFNFYYEAQLPEITGPAKLWMPIATSDRFQSVTITALDSPGKKDILVDGEFGNRILYLELGPEHSGQKVAVHYRVVRKEKGPYVGEDPQPDVFLSSSPLLPVGGQFSDIVHDVLEDKQNESQLVQARALYDYIIDNVRYAKQGKYGTGDANYACDSKSGNCTEFHSFFISLARTAGIPARFAIGAAIPANRDEGGVNGYHCWAEFYADGKWWPIDISEGNKYTALATYYFGHHPANRIEFSRGRDLIVEPGPRSGAIPFLAYPILEVEGKNIPVETNFSFQRNK